MWNWGKKCTAARATLPYTKKTQQLPSLMLLLCAPFNPNSFTHTITECKKDLFTFPPFLSIYFTRSSCSDDDGDNDADADDGFLLRLEVNCRERKRDRSKKKKMMMKLGGRRNERENAENIRRNMVGIPFLP